MTQIEAEGGKWGAHALYRLVFNLRPSASICGQKVKISTVRRLYRNLSLSLLEMRARRPAALEMRGSAVVFSPHYDDETLGAGGTIIQKRRDGAAVYLVFMTDGSRSHAHAMDGSRLSKLRRDEALQAADALGVDESHVRFLNFPETRLARYANEATRRVGELLLELRCQQVFVPSTLEPSLWSADHNVTTDIVFRALNRIGQRPEVLEYLVWFWYHWPWVPVLRCGDTRRLLKLSCRNLFGLSAWINLNTAVGIVDVQSQKQLALAKYESQMTRLVVDKWWPVLADVCQGEFLRRFFEENEFFRTYKFTGAEAVNNK